MERQVASRQGAADARTPETGRAAIEADPWDALSRGVQRLAGGGSAAGIEAVVGEFMAMGLIPGPDGVARWGYKHIGSRRWLYVSEDGAAFRYEGQAGAPGQYVALPFGDALARARERAFGSAGQP